MSSPPPGPPRKTLDDLLAVMVALRTPGTGCPWDLEQTWATIAPYTIEEAYEVADAIERGDPAALKEELGDLLLQVVYHAQIAREQGAFDFADVADAITRKMIRRHPHVFGTPEQRATGIGPGFWERIKAAERAEKKALGAKRADPAVPTPSLIDDVPAKFPALTRAVKLQSKAARAGFDWPNLAPVLAKMREELAELEVEIARHQERGGDRATIEEEFGDLMFVLANVARWLEIDPETAARHANAKFERRFRRIEALLAARGTTPALSDLAEMDTLWDQAKTEGL